MLLLLHHHHHPSYCSVQNVQNECRAAAAQPSCWCDGGVAVAENDGSLLLQLWDYSHIMCFPLLTSFYLLSLAADARIYPPPPHLSRVFICCAQDETWVLRGWWPVHVLYTTVYNSLAIEYIYCIGYCVLSFALRIPNWRAHHEQQKKDLICNAAMFSSRGTIRAKLQFNRGLNTKMQHF